MSINSSEQILASRLYNIGGSIDRLNLNLKKSPIIFHIVFVLGWLFPRIIPPSGGTKGGSHPATRQFEFRLSLNLIERTHLVPGINQPCSSGFEYAVSGCSLNCARLNSTASSIALVSFISGSQTSSISLSLSLVALIEQYTICPSKILFKRLKFFFPSICMSSSI